MYSLLKTVRKHSSYISIYSEKELEGADYVFVYASIGALFKLKSFCLVFNIYSGPLERKNKYCNRHHTRALQSN